MQSNFSTSSPACHLVCRMSRVFYLNCRLHMVSQARSYARGGVKERVTHAWHIPIGWSTANWDAVGQVIFIIAIFVPFSQLALCNLRNLKFCIKKEICKCIRNIHIIVKKKSQLASNSFVPPKRERVRERFLVRWEHKSNCRTWDKCLRTLIKMFNEMNSLIKRRLCRGP